MQPSADARLLDLVAEIQGLLDLSELWAGLLPALARLLPSDWVSLHELDVEHGVVHGYALPEPRAEWYAAFRRLAHQHPLVKHFNTIGDGRAHRLSDFVTPGELHALDLYKKVYGPMGIESQIGFVIRSDPARVVGFALARGLPDYDEDERALLNRARPFVIQAYRNALAHTAAVQTSGQAQLRRDRALAVLAGRGLTPREAETLLRAGLGHTTASTAIELHISRRTVEKHFERAYRKLGVQGRSQAVARLWELAGLPDDAGGPLIPAKGVAREA
ncbi:MAG TPA: LuxR C-terminal-related transcriptional regulator [Baekduia sp.]|nr:LuxR C-terminal-related transcriptional regulator [Baekduia sp.]